MRITLALLFALCLSAHGQALRNLNGSGTNLTVYNGLTLRTTGSTVNQTNIGKTIWWLGAGVGTNFLTINDTNGTARITLEGRSLFLSDIFGNTQLLVSDSGVVNPTSTFIGNGAGLTNLIGATNFSSSVTYNFSGKTTFNSVSYNTNAWAGPTNTLVLTTNYQFFVASTDCNITNVGGQLATQNTWTTLTISNSTAADITVRSTAAGIRAQGSSTLAALIIGAGKEGYLTYHSRGVLSTNFVTTAQQ